MTRYSIHSRKDAVPELIDDGNTTGVETPAALEQAHAAGKRPPRASRDTDRHITISWDAGIKDAVLAELSERFEAQIKAMDRRIRSLEHDRDNPRGKR